MKISRTLTLFAVLHMSATAMALDFNKPSASAASASSNEAFMKTLTKEKLFDTVCEKAEAIKKTKPADAKNKLIMLDKLMVSGGKLITPDEPMMPPIITGGVYASAFFNSYGVDLKADKNCANAPYRIQDGVAAFVRYYIDKTPQNENNALGVVESAKKMPKACGEKVVDYLNYADKRLEKCIAL